MGISFFRRKFDSLNINVYFGRKINFVKIWVRTINQTFEILVKKLQSTSQNKKLVSQALIHDLYCSNQVNIISTIFGRTKSSKELLTNPS